MEIIFENEYMSTKQKGAKVKILGYIVVAFIALYLLGGLMDGGKEQESKQNLTQSDDSGYCQTGHLLVRRALFPHWDDKEARSNIRRAGECIVDGFGNRRMIEYGYQVARMGSVVTYRADVVKENGSYRLCGVEIKANGTWDPAPENERLSRHMLCQ